MEEWLRYLATHVALIIELLAVFVIAAGTVEAFVTAARRVLSRAAGARFREVWIRYAHWLIAGLTFLLAANLVHTAVAPTWGDIGKLAAIAAIRTVLNFFLERDMRDAEVPGSIEPATRM
ncbi:MAG: DUF1622 domain-containing protein [Gammaproteobacteria bacterium]